MVDSLCQWWETLSKKEKQAGEIIQIKMDNSPENSDVRTQFLKRMVELAAQIKKSFHLLYFPPYHSKYNPIELCWGISVAESSYESVRNRHFLKLQIMN